MWNLLDYESKQTEVGVNMKLVGMDFISGKYLGTNPYKGKGKNFPLINLYILREEDKKTITILADRVRWESQGGNKLKPPNDRINVSVAIYEHKKDGEEILYHMLEDLLEVIPSER